MFPLTSFSNDNFRLRAFQVGEEWFFAAKDVAEQLGYSKPSSVARALVEPEFIKPYADLYDYAHDRTVPENLEPLLPEPKAGTALDPQTLYLTEGGLYQLAGTSNKPAARQFRLWLFGEVVPSIRRTGGYTLPSGSEAPALIPRELPTPAPLPKLPGFSPVIEQGALLLNGHPVDIRTVQTDQGPVKYAYLQDLCDAVGVSLPGQWRKVKTRSDIRHITLSGLGPGRPRLYIMLDDVLYWLDSISPVRIKKEVRKDFVERKKAMMEAVKKALAKSKQDRDTRHGPHLTSPPSGA